MESGGLQKPLRSPTMQPLALQTVGTILWKGVCSLALRF